MQCSPGVSSVQRREMERVKRNRLGNVVCVFWVWFTRMCLGAGSVRLVCVSVCLVRVSVILVSVNLRDRYLAAQGQTSAF